MRGAPRAPFEQLREMVGAHSRDRRELLEADLVRQVVLDELRHALEAVSRQASPVGFGREAADRMAPDQIHCQRVGQRPTVEFPRR